MRLFYIVFICKPIPLNCIITFQNGLPALVYHYAEKCTITVFNSIPKWNVIIVCHFPCKPMLLNYIIIFQNGMPNRVEEI